MIIESCVIVHFFALDIEMGTKVLLCIHVDLVLYYEHVHELIHHEMSLILTKQVTN